MIQLRAQLAFQKYGRDAHPHGAKGSSIALDGNADFIDLGRTVDHDELLTKAAVAHQAKAFAGRQRITLQRHRRIGVKHGAALRIGDGGVIDGTRVSHDGLHQRVEARVSLKDLFGRPAHRLRIAGINLRAVEVYFQGFVGDKKNLVSDEVAGLICLLHALADNLQHVDAGKHHHQRHYHAADGEYELRLET